MEDLGPPRGRKEHIGGTDRLGASARLSEPPMAVDWRPRPLPPRWGGRRAGPLSPPISSAGWCDIAGLPSAVPAGRPGKWWDRSSPWRYMGPASWPATCRLSWGQGPSLGLQVGTLEVGRLGWNVATAPAETWWGVPGPMAWPGRSVPSSPSHVRSWSSGVQAVVPTPLLLHPVAPGADDRTVAWRGWSRSKPEVPPVSRTLHMAEWGPSLACPQLPRVATSVWAFGWIVPLGQGYSISLSWGPVHEKHHKWGAEAKIRLFLHSNMFMCCIFKLHNNISALYISFFFYKHSNVVFWSITK